MLERGDRNPGQAQRLNSANAILGIWHRLSSGSRSCRLCSLGLGVQAVSRRRCADRRKQQGTGGACFPLPLPAMPRVCAGKQFRETLRVALRHRRRRIGSYTLHHSELVAGPLNELGSGCRDSPLPVHRATSSWPKRFRESAAVVFGRQPGGAIIAGKAETGQQTSAFGDLRTRSGRGTMAAMTAQVWPSSA